jgi:hypothetical protein
MSIFTRSLIAHAQASITNVARLTRGTLQFVNQWKALVSELIGGGARCFVHGMREEW